MFNNPKTPHCLTPHAIRSSLPTICLGTFETFLSCSPNRMQEMQQVYCHIAVKQHFLHLLPRLQTLNENSWWHCACIPDHSYVKKVGKICRGMYINKEWCKQLGNNNFWVEYVLLAVMNKLTNETYWFWPLQRPKYGQFICHVACHHWHDPCHACREFKHVLLAAGKP